VDVRDHEPEEAGIEYTRVQEVPAEPVGYLIHAHLILLTKPETAQVSALPGGEYTPCELGLSFCLSSRSGARAVACLRWGIGWRGRRGWACGRSGEFDRFAGDVGLSAGQEAGGSGGDDVVADLVSIVVQCRASLFNLGAGMAREDASDRSEEHTSELQSRFDLVCRLL